MFSPFEVLWLPTTVQKCASECEWLSFSISPMTAVAEAIAKPPDTLRSRIGRSQKPRIYRTMGAHLSVSRTHNIHTIIGINTRKSCKT